MKLSVYSGLCGIGLLFLAGCGSETAVPSVPNDPSGHAGAAGNGGDVGTVAGGGARGDQDSLPDAGSGGEAGTVDVFVPRTALKPVLLYVATSAAGKALYSWHMSDGAPAIISGTAKAGFGVKWFYLSPDGQRVAFILEKADDDTGEVYVVDTDGSNRRRLSGAAVAGVSPASVSWSGTGKYVSYDTYDAGNPDASPRSYILDVDTGQVLESDGLLSPDDALLAVYEQGALFVERTDGSARIELVKSKDAPGLVWSPDARLLLTLTKDAGPTVFSADGFHVWNFNAGDQWPEWAPNGRSLAYYRKGQLFIWSPGASEIPVSVAGETVHAWSWSPDGTQIAVAGNSLQTTYATGGPFFTVNPQGTENSEVFGVSWSPDSKYLAYGAIEEKGAPRKLFVAHPDGKANHEIGDHLTARLWTSRWAPTSEYVAYRDTFDESQWYVASLSGENTFVSDGTWGAWSDDGEFFAVEAGTVNRSVRVLRLSDKHIIAPDGPLDGHQIAFGLAAK